MISERIRSVENVCFASIAGIKEMRNMCKKSKFSEAYTAIYW